MADHLEPFRSLIEKPNKSYAEEAAILWLCIYQVLDKYLQRNKDWLAVRHEDLSRDPINQFRSLYGKLSLKFTPRIENKIRQYTESQKAVRGELVLKRDSVSLAGKWKADLSAEEIAIIKKITGALAAKYYPEAND